MGAVYRTVPSGDLAINEASRSFVMIEGVHQVRQRLSSRLKFFLGEWFLDLRQGVPYLRDVFRKNPSAPVIRSLLRRVIIGTPGVISLHRFDLTIDPKTRRAGFNFEAIANGGRIVVRPGDEDFLVDLPRL
jgi:hypothetical protein